MMINNEFCSTTYITTFIGLSGVISRFFGYEGIQSSTGSSVYNLSIVSRVSSVGM